MTPEVIIIKNKHKNTAPCSWNDSRFFLTEFLDGSN